VVQAAGADHFWQVVVLRFFDIAFVAASLYWLRRSLLLLGMSKALMERVMVAKSRLCDPGKTVLCGTRYGNVMASRGSVSQQELDNAVQNNLANLASVDAAKANVDKAKAAVTSAQAAVEKAQADVTTAYRIALVIAATIAVVAAPVSFVGLGPHARARSSARRTICPVDGPPLQPDPHRCPVAAGAG